MDTKNIIMQGERAKYFMRSEKSNFNLYDNSFYLEIIYGMLGKKITIRKKDFLFLDGKWFFSFPTTDIVGPVKARLVMELFDPDCPQDVRPEVDEQYIAFIVTDPCPQFLKCPCVGGDHEIVYERTEESDIGKRYALISDFHGARLRNADGGFLFVLKQ